MNFHYYIQKTSDGSYLFGNKNFTADIKNARTFSSEKDAHFHIENWFDPSTVTVIPGNDF